MDTPTPKAADVAAAKVLLVYCYSEGKESHWVRPDAMNGEHMLFSSKTGRGKIIGGVYQFDATDEAGTKIFPTSARFQMLHTDAPWRAEMSARQTAINTLRTAQNDDPIEEVLRPLLVRYKRMPINARASMLLKVVAAFRRASMD